MQDLIWPPPKACQVTPGNLALSSLSLPVYKGHHVAIHWWLNRIATRLPSSKSASLQWQQEHNCSDLKPGHYQLELNTQKLHLRTADEAGTLAALQTLWQIVDAAAATGSLSCLTIDDGPDFENRGIMLDISRGKVPAMETLFDLIDRFAQWKINQLQLYVEHTFAYRGHREVWQDHTPLTAAELKQLVSYCADRGIQLVANQNSFGHFHRWLCHARYRPLAECPAGIEHPFSLHPEPFSLCPGDPGSLALLRDLYDQMVPLTRSNLLNVGLDETFDLGMGRSRADCEQRGKSTVYLEFLNAVAELAREHGCRIMFWGDILIQQPQLLHQVPEDAVPLLWGYEADHPFEQETQAVAATGRDFYVCPGTSSWNSLGGRYDNAMANLRAAAKQGHQNGAKGYLITDWGDFGHLQPLVISLPAFTYGAGLSWNRVGTEPQEHRAAKLALQLDYDCNADTTLVFKKLAQVHTASGCAIMNGSALFFALIRSKDSLDHVKLAPLREADFAAAEAALEKVLPAWHALSSVSLQHHVCTREIHWCHDLLAFAINFSRWRLAPEKQDKADLRRQLAQLLAQFEAVRNLRYRSGAAAESKRYLWQLLTLLSSQTPRK